MLTKVRKQERGGVTSGSGNYFGKVRSYEKKHKHHACTKEDLFAEVDELEAFSEPEDDEI